MSSESGRIKSDLKRPFVFLFVHHFNDVDHIVPFAYKLCESERGRPVVLVTDHLDIDGDYRLRFLREKYDVQVVVCETLQPPNPVAGFLAQQLNKSTKNKLLIRFQKRLMRILRRIFYTEKWAGNILDQYKPTALVFEAAQRTGGPFGKFLLASRERRIVTFALPHGLHYITNDLVNRKEQAEGHMADDRYLNIFDWVVCQSHHVAERYTKQGVLPEKVVVLGSTRFCREWQRLNFLMQPESFKPTKEQGDKLGVVFMIPQWNYNADFDATMRTLQRLSEEPWLHLVLKPQTREVEVYPRYLSSLQSHPNVEVASYAGSVPLIAWSDAVIVVGSSIALEVLLQGKPHLATDYLDENSNAFQEEGAQWTVNNDDELVEALQQIRQGSLVPYTQAQVDNVFQRLVLGGSNEEDVLMRYVDSILGEWHNPPTYKEVSI